MAEKKTDDEVFIPTIETAITVRAFVDADTLTRYAVECGIVSFGVYDNEGMANDRAVSVAHAIGLEMAKVGGKYVKKRKPV